MNAVEIEEAVSDLVLQPFDPAEFPFQFLESFGNKALTIKRLRKGTSNRTDVEGAVLQRSNIHILTTEPGEVEKGLRALRESPKTEQQKAKFILATDGQTLSAEDLKSGETLDCAYADLPNHFGFLLPLAGITTNKEIKNNPIDIKATGRLDKLYVELLQDERNKDWANEDGRERFNHFMAQLIFCFYAEDTSIFQVPGLAMFGDRPKGWAGLFTETVREMSESDGSNTDYIVAEIFRAMDIDTREGKRAAANVKSWADKFPYVNGGLFGDRADVPKFTKMARTYLLRAGELKWTDINPDIFGSMIQAVADDDERGELGMHYTSVPNILKVLNPLFLDDLNAQLERAGSNPQSLGKLKKRLAHIRVFDPACGSGNFLVIAYKRMREIEHKANLAAGWGAMESEIPVRNFRGIELKSFAAEVARLALVIAEYQSDEIYIGQKQADIRFLPLDTQNWIVCGNALRLDWLSTFPPPGEKSVKVQNWTLDLSGGQGTQNEIAFDNEGGETYICGNPPYLGSTWQSKAQKDDLKQIFDGRTKSWKSLDYVAGWFMKGADYMSHTEGTCAFVSTNSICQGQQVPILWPLVFATENEIVFAHTSFKWNNLASHNAGVTVIIVGLSKSYKGPKRLIQVSKEIGLNDRTVSKINAYLVPGNSVIVVKAPYPLNLLPEMIRGNMPYDGGNLLLSKQDLEALELSQSQKSKLVKRIYGSAEFISGKDRFCLWITDENLPLARKNLGVSNRIEAVREIRLASNDRSANKMAKTAHQMREMNIGTSHSIVTAAISSENRPFLPVGLISHQETVTNKMYAIHDAPLWNMALIASRLHWVWIGTVCVRMRTDFSYSNTLGWNTFPVPKLTSRNKDDLTRTAENILLAREAHFPATIADLYKPNSDKHPGMPENLRAVHNENDRILEEIYIGRRFKNDTERLEKLFEMYTEMTKAAG